MTTDFLEHCAMNFIRVVLRTPNCSTIQQFEDLVNFWAFKNNADFGWYKVRMCLNSSMHLHSSHPSSMFAVEATAGGHHAEEHAGSFLSPDV